MNQHLAVSNISHDIAFWVDKTFWVYLSHNISPKHSHREWKWNWTEKYDGQHLQDYRNNNEELPITSKLFAVVHLFPPSQSVVRSLVISKRCSFLPMEKMLVTRWGTWAFSLQNTLSKHPENINSNARTRPHPVNLYSHPKKDAILK